MTANEPDIRRELVVSDHVCHICHQGHVVIETRQRWKKHSPTWFGKLVRKFFPAESHTMTYAEEHFYCNACGATFSFMPPRQIEKQAKTADTQPGKSRNQEIAKRISLPN